MPVPAPRLRRNGRRRNLLLLILKADIHGDAGSLQNPFVRLALQTGNTVFVDAGFCSIDVTMSLDAEYLCAQGLQGGPGLVIVYAVSAGSVPDDGLVLKQVIVDQDIGNTGWIGCAETG